MIKVKDGYAKLIGTTYSGSVSRVLLSNGGDHILGNSNGNIPLNNGTVNTNLNADMLDGLHIHAGRNNEVNKIVRTDANGFLLTGWINTTSGNIGTGAINKIYCSNDDYIRYKTPANFFPTLANSGNDISITVAGLNRTLTVGYATNADKVDGYHASSFALVNNINYADLYAQKFITGKLNDGVTRWLVYAFNGNQTQTVDNLLSKIPDKVLSPNGSNVVTQLTTGIYLWEDNNIGSGNYADSYTGYARTYLYSNSAQTLTFVIYTDDNSSIFLNNTLLATPSSCQNTSLSFSLVKGWNKIEIIWYEGGGGDGFHVNYNGSRLHNSFLIDCFAIDSNNYSNSAGSATKVIVTLHTANDVNYPLVWSNLANTNTVTENQLHKSWSDLYYNPKNKRLTVGGSVVASSFVKNGGTSLQLLRADGGIATFNWSGQSGLPTWLWGGNNLHSYYVYNPSNFRVAYASSAGNADTVDGYHASKFPYINNSGVWKVYGNSAAAALADNTAGLSSWAFGESRNSGITYLGILKPSTATCGINAHGTIAVFGQGDTHLGIASDYSSANLQVFGGNADKIVWRKKIAFADGTGVSGTWGINILGNAASATKSEYSRSLLGRSTSGSDYDTNRANLIFAEWDTMHDNRWYLKATGCECRVAYANSAKNAANADTVDGYHANGLLTALSNSNNGISITVGGTTKSVSNISVNYAGSAGNADTTDGVHITWAGELTSTNHLVAWEADGSALRDINPANISVGNSDKVDGYHASSGNKPWGTIPVITTLGFMDIGNDLEFHYDNTTGSDYSTALMCQGNYNNTVYLPSASGTLALTSDIPNPTNYYWANVKISASSSTTTSPTVSNLTATNSIKMGNILLEHTDEINNITNESLHLNYRNTGNITLCNGGGAVTIGTTSTDIDSNKLYVNGSEFINGASNVKDYVFANGFRHRSYNSNNAVLLAGGGYMIHKTGTAEYSTAILFGKYVWLTILMYNTINESQVVPDNISKPTKNIYIYGAASSRGVSIWRISTDGVIYLEEGVSSVTHLYTTICYVAGN